MNATDTNQAATPRTSSVQRAAPVSDDQVLSTLNADGSRRWLRPRVSRGRFWKARRITAYGLIVLFAVLPHLSIHGRPILLLDVAHRRFTFFGATFLPTDTALLALLVVTIFLAIFLITALFGRVWCGWACPQTVYMEFLYRPIERLFDGEPGKKQTVRRAAGLRRVGKYVAFLLASLFLAHTFLAYFVPPAELRQWVTRSPVEHPTAFLVMATTTLLMLVDFTYFREQTCLIACPYGRFQAAMLDRQSLIVTYDERRGEPRGKKKRAAGDVALPVLADERGDCIDCRMCVTTCPTGIDIRNGLQMECVGCAQCIDACDAVMEKIGRPRGLIRYSSMAAVSGEKSRLLRPRIVVYPLVMVVLVGIFGALLTSRTSAEAAILPRQGSPFYALESGEIANQVRLRIVNRSLEDATYTVSVAAPEGARIDPDHPSLTLTPTASETVGFVVAVPASLMGPRGRCDVSIVVRGSDGYEKTLEFHALGPVHRSAP